MHPEPRPTLGSISPFFIVSDIPRALEFYTLLGFEVRYLAEPDSPFFAIVGRDAAQLFLKAPAESVSAQPNRTVHEWAPWDAFLYTEEPDALAAEFASKGVRFSKALGDLLDDGLRGFELHDHDGYALFFGRPMTQGDSRQQT